MDEQDETELLAQAVKGDTEAFRRLYEAHHAALFRFAYSLTSAIDVAEDLTHECFVRLTKTTKFHNHQGALRPYLYGIMRNLLRQRQQATGR